MPRKQSNIQTLQVTLQVTQNLKNNFINISSMMLLN